MATVQSGRNSDDWLVDDKILVENYGRTIRLRDYATGQVIENVGDITAAKTRAEFLISSGKWATHEAGAGSGAWTKFGGTI